MVHYRGKETGLDITRCVNQWRRLTEKHQWVSSDSLEDDLCQMVEGWLKEEGVRLGVAHQMLRAVMDAYERLKKNEGQEAPPSGFGNSPASTDSGSAT